MGWLIYIIIALFHLAIGFLLAAYLIDSKERDLQQQADFWRAAYIDLFKRLPPKELARLRVGMFL